ncbi:MAG: MGMT family protein [Cryobacterium sp.]|uniref:MGMT family protein n=1 Tax=Cryobacterium sp. TaxID=1926290 RepID=UPI00229D5F2F|nr:MGMT family protein [Cryobacterium sp.]MCY7403255.1 MGMT family protein [Cryobacterium sp.]
MVVAIPKGDVPAYGEIGRALDIGPRQAGRAVALLDDDVPWSRVVHADGTPASCYNGGARALLETEGVPFRNGRVDMPAIRRWWSPSRRVSVRVRVRVRVREKFRQRCGPVFELTNEANPGVRELVPRHNDARPRDTAQPRDDMHPGQRGARGHVDGEAFDLSWGA